MQRMLDGALPAPVLGQCSPGSRDLSQLGIQEVLAASPAPRCRGLSAAAYSETLGLQAVAWLNRQPNRGQRRA